jgi:catechol 2,3-dioxygenase-like lactoylglutathione lyase family enzyme
VSRSPVPPAVQALWLPYEVADIDAAAAFFIDHLGLSTVDGWTGSDGRGVVLKVADGAFIEFASHGAGAPAPVAFELASPEAVGAVHRRIHPRPRPPERFPRGHYGFGVGSPVGPVMVWSEK